MYEILFVELFVLKQKRTFIKKSVFFIFYNFKNNFKKIECVNGKWMLYNGKSSPDGGSHQNYKDLWWKRYCFVLKWFKLIHHLKHCINVWMIWVCQVKRCDVMFWWGEKIVEPAAWWLEQWNQANQSINTQEIWCMNCCTNMYVYTCHGVLKYTVSQTNWCSWNSIWSHPPSMYQWWL